MPRFYFDFSDLDALPDHEGTELKDASAAQRHALKLCGEMLHHWPEHFWSVGSWDCSVRDEQGLVFAVVHFHVSDGPTPLGHKLH